MNKIFNDDPEAIQKLTVKLEGLQTEKIYWKNLKPEKRDYSINETDGMKRWYKLQNLNQNINQIKKRIAKLESMKAQNISLERKAVFPDGKKRFKYVEVKQ